ncbi:MAG: EMC3/TMCO1 family protein [Promethearchaeota archaeon]
MQDLWGSFMAWFAATFAFFKTPPYAAFFIMFVSMSISTISNLAMKRFTDMRRLNRYQLEIKQFREMEQKAQKTQNEKLLKKVKRRKSYIERIQREQMSARCKPSLMFLIPFIILFTVLRGFYSTGGVDDIVAVLPFNIQKVLPFLVGLAGRPVAAGFGLSFYAFYFLVGLGLSSILQRMMGTQVMTT